MIRINTPSIRNAQQYFTTLLIILFFSSCSTLSHMDKAQDEFNKGAEIENEALLNQSISLVSPPRSSDYYYKRAYSEVNQALLKEGKLKKLEIYVNAATIKALCEWKLNNYDEAKKTAKVATDYMEAKNISADDLPREFAVLHSMSALIGIEDMNEKQSSFFKTSPLTTEAALAEYKKLIHKEAAIAGNIEKDLEDLESVSGRINDKHEVQTYLVMSKLSALKVWSDALNSIRTTMKKNGNFDGNNQDYYDAEKESLDAAKEKYAKVLRDQVGKDHSVYKHWDFLLGFQSN